MEGDRWKAVERLYHQAAARPHGEQAAFLESACAGDKDLRREVESLLAAGGDGFLEEPALDLAARDLAKDGAILSSSGRMPVRTLEVRIRNIKKVKGYVEVAEQPTAANNFTAVIRIRNNEKDSADYEFEVSW